VSITGGTVTATSSVNGAGIGSGYNNGAINISISNATVNATSNQGAAIGSGWSAASGTIVIDSGTITALAAGGAAIGSGPNSTATSITINGGTINARATGGGAAIGGGFLSSSNSIIINGGTLTLVSNTLAPVIGSGVAGGAGGTILVGTGAVVSVSKSQLSTVVGGTNGSAAITLNGALTILQGILVAPTSGGGLTIGSTGVLRGAGELSGASAVTNNGSITASVLVSATNVLVHNFLVTFTADPTVGYAGGTTRIYATSFSNAETTLPDPVAGYDASWYTAASGGILFTEASAIASDITLFPRFVSTALAATGTDVLPAAPIAAAIVLLGLVLVIARRRASAAPHTITG
jgi:hypothetical protein